MAGKDASVLSRAARKVARFSHAGATASSSGATCPAAEVHYLLFLSVALYIHISTPTTDRLPVVFGEIHDILTLTVRLPNCLKPSQMNGKYRVHAVWK